MFNYSKGKKTVFCYVDTFFPFSECAPSTTFQIDLKKEETNYMSGFVHSGFVCHRRKGTEKCRLCSTGSRIHVYSGTCQECPAGNAYSDNLSSEFIRMLKKTVMMNDF